MTTPSPTTAPRSGSPATVITPDELLAHWQGHRRLTRRVIEAFPEREFESFTIGGMRPFSRLALEMISMAVPSLTGVISGKWEGSSAGYKEPRPKAEVLRRWDEATAEIDRLWPTIPPHRFQEVDRAFGMCDNTGTGMILYLIDNEIHHRGQGYVYLRALGIEPPAFWER